MRVRVSLGVPHTMNINQPQQSSLFEVRTKICNTCTSYNKIMNTCQQTEKLIMIYAKKLNNVCPINRWPQ